MKGLFIPVILSTLLCVRLNAQEDSSNLTSEQSRFRPGAIAAVFMLGDDGVALPNFGMRYHFNARNAIELSLGLENQTGDYSRLGGGIDLIYRRYYRMEKRNKIFLEIGPKLSYSRNRSGSDYRYQSWQYGATFGAGLDWSIVPDVSLISEISGFGTYVSSLREQVDYRNQLNRDWDHYTKLNMNQVRIGLAYFL